MSRAESGWRRYGSLLCLLMILTIAVYIPGLDGDFEFDDGPNILDNAALRISSLSWDELVNATLSGSSGPLGRPISMASFALNYYFSGYSPYFFKLTNVFIHLAAGAAVFFLAWQVASVVSMADHKIEDSRKRIGLLAATVAGAWLLHPLNLTSVLYVVQRMTSLSALFTFIAVGTYVLGRRRINADKFQNGWCLILAALIPITGLGMLSKENAVLAPLLMLCTESILFHFSCPNRKSRVVLMIMFASMIMVPLIVLGISFERVSSYITTPYVGREFTIVERLLTQPRVLFFYLEMLFSPRAGAMGLYHDDFPVSHGVTQPISTSLALVLLTFLIVLGIYAVRRAPVLAFGIFWFFASHVLESSVIALEMVHEHRNYLAIMGPLFTCFYYLFQLRRPVFSDRLKTGISVTIIAVLGTVTLIRSMQWSDLVDHAAVEVHNHPNSVTANYQMGRLYFKLYGNNPRPDFRRLSEQFFQRSAELSEQSVFPLIGLIQLASREGELPDQAMIDKVKIRLARIDWNPNMDAIVSMVVCQVKHFCKLPHESVISILQTVIDNPKAGPKSLGTANSLMGNYLALEMDDLPGAQQYLVAAVNAEKNRLEYRLDLLGLMVVTHNFDGAREQLSIARKMDKLNMNKSRLDAESQMIDRMALDQRKALP